MTDEQPTIVHEQPKSHPFLGVLESCLRESLEVQVFFPSGQFRGTVVRLDEQIVELRCQARRCLMRLDRIDAIVKE